MNYSSSQIPKRIYKLVNELEFTKKEIKLMGYEKVIRCKDCGHRDCEDNYCFRLDRHIKLNDFCSLAEKEDDANDH